MKGQVVADTGCSKENSSSIRQKISVRVSSVSQTLD